MNLQALFETNDINDLAITYILIGDSIVRTRIICFVRGVSKYHRKAFYNALDAHF